ncbi:MAG: HAMP domain-containing sensor histidine kinase, partial [Verrucomicrobiota bacterium]
DGTLAFASSSGQVFAQRYDPEIKKWSPIQLRKHSNGHYSISQTKEGKLLFGGAGVIAAYKEGRAENYRYTELGIPISPLNVYESFDGRIWVLASYGGVYVMDPTFRNWKTLLGLHFQCAGTNEDEWYISRDKRVVYFDKRHERWFQFEPSDGIIDIPKRITKGPDGTLWALGSHSDRAAVSFLDDANRWQTRTFPEIGAFIGRNSYTFLPDGRLIVTNGQAKAVPRTGGIAIVGRSQSNQLKYFEFLRAPKFPEWAYHVERASDGSIWIASNTIHQVDLEKQTSETIHKFPHGRTDALIHDSNQSLWIAKGFGFGVWKKSHASEDWHAYGKPDGLASNRASGLLALGDGKVLASSENGISLYDGDKWSDHATSEHFAITRWEDSEMRKDANNSLWLNLGKRDTIKHRPNRLLQDLKYYTIRYKPESNAPETTIISYQKSISPGGHAHIAWSGIDPWEQTHRENLEYSWRLNDTDWTFFSSKKNHTFLALEPGSYTLEVRSRDRNGNIEIQPALITFKVDNYIWARPWFIGLVGTLLALTIALILVTIRWREQRLLNEKQRIEERERHLQEIDEIKTGFVNNISHEINTPLTAMIVPLERITARIESDDRMKRRLTSIIANAQRVKRLVSQLLLFRDIEKGELKLELQTIDLAQLLRRTTESMQVIAEIHQIQLKLQASNTFPAYTDPDAIEKILQNLISNALKYTQDSGEVIITLGPTDPNKEHPYIQITVEDNGFGISPEFKKHVFDRFYRVPEKSLIDGSGIGLNLTKKLVQQCGGTIEIESPIYESIVRPGTRVSVELPRLPIPRNSKTKSESLELNPTQ